MLTGMSTERRWGFVSLYEQLKYTNVLTHNFIKKQKTPVKVRDSESIQCYSHPTFHRNPNYISQGATVVGKDLYKVLHFAQVVL